MEQRERIEAKFITRENRFVGEVDLDGRRIPVYIPNTGRMLELLIPGRKVILAPSNGKFAYKLEYVIYRDNPVLIDSIQSNRIFHDLIERKKIPHLEKYSIREENPALVINVSTSSSLITIQMNTLRR